MICPHCHSINREGAKFCDECGLPLTGKIAEMAAYIENEESLSKPSSIPEEKPFEDSGKTEAHTADKSGSQVLKTQAPEMQAEREELLETQAPEMQADYEEPLETQASAVQADREEPPAAQAPAAQPDRPTALDAFDLASLPSIEIKEAPADKRDDAFSFISSHTHDDFTGKSEDYSGFACDADLSGFDECIVDSHYVPPSASWRSGDTMEMPRIEEQTKSSHKEFRAPAPGKTKRKKGKIVIAIIFCLAIACGVAAGITYYLEMWGGKTIPDVEGMTEADAIYVLEHKGFLVHTSQVTSDEIGGIVLDMEPGAGARQELGTEVTVHISVVRTIPDVVGQQRDAALYKLQERGYKNVSFTSEKSDEYENTVLGIYPEVGARTKANDPVTLTLAEPYRVPDVSGLSWEEAALAIEEAGLIAVSVYVYDDSVAEGTLLSTAPAAGEPVTSGTQVTVSIARSRGAELEACAQSYLSSVGTLTLGGVTYEIYSVDAVNYQGNNTTAFTISAAAVTTLDGETVRGSVKQKNGSIVWDDANNIVSVS